MTCLKMCTIDLIYFDCIILLIYKEKIILYKMSLDSSQWVFSKYKIFIIFSKRLVKLFKIKIVFWYMWQGQQDHLIYDGGVFLTVHEASS